jgi:type IV pilus assembly protein PilB
MAETLKDKIIKALINSQGLKREQIEEALFLQRTKGLSLDQVLVEKGLINEKDLFQILVRELNIPFINLNRFKIDPALRDIIPEKTARKYRMVPLSVLEYTMTVALADPLNVFAIDDIKNLTGKDVDVVMSTHTEIIKAIDNLYGASGIPTVTDISKDIEIEDFEIVSEKEAPQQDDTLVDESEKAPIIRMVNLVIKEALRQRASDIHVEPTIDGMRVRYRIDGVLHDILDIPKQNQNAVIVRIKIMSRLDITVNQVPQDGRFKLKLHHKEVDFRVSLLPTTYGQKIVMRVLDKGNLSIGLEGLGISEGSLKFLIEAIKAPFGMILVTGPTGSGKSTTLYSIINELNTVDKNIITVEDPVEYLIEGLTQIQARPEIGLTFAEGLRSILRQSPDVVMVGEIRDNETADIAIKASLTGQLVFSTLHTNDAPGALTRLVDMNVEPFLVASSLVLVSAQRLCRKICPHCKEEENIPAQVLARLHYPLKANAKFYHGKGCIACRQSGYLGRSCITEVLSIDDHIRDMLITGKSSDDIKKYAREERGMKTLYEDIVEKCLAGVTTIEEVFRITISD